MPPRKYPKMKKMAVVGHYRPRTLKLPGLSNMPAPGRPSKSVPQLKKMSRGKVR